MTATVLSIGSNVGDRFANLQGAVDAVRAWLVAVSPVYETAPWGPVEQDDFLNAVLLVHDDAASPEQWLARAHDAERAADRTREVHWGPRTLDVDVVAVGQEKRDDPELVVPHPRAGERAFVLVPWLAADRDAVLGIERVADLVAALPADDVAGVRLRGDLVLR